MNHLDHLNQIKILHTEWSGGWGGQELRILSEMEGLRARGYWVGLAAAPHTPIYKKMKSLGFPVFALGFKGNLDFKTFMGLIKIIRAEKINIVNTHSGKDTYVGGLAAKFCGVKFIRTRHLSYAIKKTSFINKLADHIVTTGEPTRQSMIQKQNIHPDKITSIPSRPDENLFNPENYKKSEIREFLGISKDELVIGIVAFFRRMKRLDNFIEMASLLKTRNKNLKLKFVLVGDGPFRAELEALIKEKNLDQEVLLVGHQENPAKFMAAFDIGVLSSDSGEATPQVLMQYLMMGLPIMATEICHIEGMPSSSAYQLVPVNNILVWTETLEKLLKDFSAVQDETKKLRAYMLAQHSLKIMLDQMEKIILGLVKK